MLQHHLVSRRKSSRPCKFYWQKICHPNRKSKYRVLMVQEVLERKPKVDLHLKLDLEIWSKYPDNEFWKTYPKTNIYRMKISSSDNWRGTFNGKRFFMGTLPNRHQFKEHPLEVRMERFEDGFSYFKLIEDNWDEEWEKLRELFIWYYDGRPGNRLLAPYECFEDEQIVVVKVKPGDYRRGRFLKEGRPKAVVRDLDSGTTFPVSKHNIYAMDDQFLRIPYRAFRCSVTNVLVMIQEEHVKKNWPLFVGTNSFQSAQQELPSGLEDLPGVSLIDMTVDYGWLDTFRVDVILDFECPLLRDCIQEILLDQVRMRFKRVEDCNCRVTHISKKGAVWLCNDGELLDAVQKHINHHYTHHESSLSWKRDSPEVGQTYILWNYCDRKVYRVSLLNKSRSEGSEWYEVEYIDYGMVRKVTSVSDFWGKLPNSNFPTYLNSISPLCKKYQLHGIDFVKNPYRIMESLKGKEVTVKVEDANRVEQQDRSHCYVVLPVPTVSLKIIDGNGESTDFSSAFQDCFSSPSYSSSPRRSPKYGHYAGKK